MKEQEYQKNLKVLIVDDHKLMLEGLKRLSEECGLFSEVHTAISGTDCLSMASDQFYDFIFLDISMPEMNGIETLTELKKRKISSEVVMITMHHDFTSSASALRLGAKGYILKDSGMEEIVNAVQSIKLGNIYISPEVKNMLKTINNMNSDFNVLPDPYSILSDRELQIARMIAAGKSYTDIASELYLSPTTIETHRRNIFNKLKINKTSSLIKFLYDNKFLA
jgi:DNA-binding NarL/FixJ family response regulator